MWPTNLVSRIVCVSGTRRNWNKGGSRLWRASARRARSFSSAICVRAPCRETSEDKRERWGRVAFIVFRLSYRHTIVLFFFLFILKYYQTNFNIFEAREILKIEYRTYRKYKRVTIKNIKVQFTTIQRYNTSCSYFHSCNTLKFDRLILGEIPAVKWPDSISTFERIFANILRSLFPLYTRHGRV